MSEKKPSEQIKLFGESCKIGNSISDRVLINAVIKYLDEQHVKKEAKSE